MLNDEIGIEELSRAVAKTGASRAKLIKSSDVVVRDWVRFKCQFGCHDYGHTLACPPYTPTPDQTRKILSEYDKAILLEFKDAEDARAVNEDITRLEKEVFLSGHPAAIAFSAGKCRLCPKCNLSHCVNPMIVRPSMEACGIDVFTTARKAGFELNIAQDKSQKINRIGLLLVE